ncbi:ROK family protein [Allonocardiopsis opalescens]|uniref:Glucokinase n=1 Tax=Allonocardiopsis opalescens TaxID=1144618 RepID=A0A2T0PZW6_9ACTN|nr:ROK family protein [Allonocardiopsis opalescens]PRX97074.1 glucokinase [Allonocardiopsis opalescens]
MTTASPGRGEVLAIDIGGTKIAAALVGPAGAVRAQVRVPTPRGTDDAERVWAAVRAALERVRAQAGPGGADGLGVCCAGPVDLAAGTVSPVNIPAWRGFPLIERLSALVPGPVELAGDGMCAALGEYGAGAGRGSAAMLGMVVSTGVGGGLVLDGRPYLGPTGNAGHIGHVLVEPGGEPCGCGSAGCLETVAAGPYLAAWARRRGWEAPPEAGPRELAEAARRGLPVAVESFERAGRALGTAIAGAAALFDLDRVVIGGGVAESGEVLLGPVRRHVRALARLGFQRRLRVERSALGGAAGLVGAAGLLRSREGAAAAN